MACALRVFVFALLQFSASVYASTSHIDDATVMLQSARESLAGQTPTDDIMLLTKSSGMRHLLQVEGSRERLAATQKMERSMETAVTKIITGQAGAPSPEFFEDIDREMNLMIAELFHEKDGFQLQINTANANVATCNTNRQAKSAELNATGSFKEDADLLKIDHGTCRAAELSAYNAKTSSCDLLATKTLSASNAAPQCNCALSDTDTADVLTCLASNKNWVDSHETDLTTQKSDCDTKTQTWSSEASRCDTLQSNYEGAVCIYDEKLEDMCSTLDTCYDQAILFRTSVVENVRVEEEHLKTMLASAKKIVCFLNILKEMDTQKFTMSDLEACKSLNVSTDTTYLNKSVLDVDITYSPADAKTACQTLSSTPGDGQWAAAEYAGYTTAWLLDTVVCPHQLTTTPTPTAAPTPAPPTGADFASCSWESNPDMSNRWNCGGKPYNPSMTQEQSCAQAYDGDRTTPACSYNNKLTLTFSQPKNINRIWMKFDFPRYDPKELYVWTLDSTGTEHEIENVQWTTGAPNVTGFSWSGNKLSGPGMAQEQDFTFDTVYSATGIKLHFSKAIDGYHQIYEMGYGEA